MWLFLLLSRLFCLFAFPAFCIIADALLSAFTFHLSESGVCVCGPRSSRLMVFFCGSLNICVAAAAEADP